MNTPTDAEISLEREIQAKGLTAPRVTPAQIETTIVHEYSFTAHEGVIGSIYVHNQHGDMPPMIGTHESLSLLTICVLVLKNGFTVTGESACASPENFDAELGRKIARGHAVDKIWLLEGYLLKQGLFEKSPQVGAGG